MKLLTDEQINEYAEERFPQYPDSSTDYCTIHDFEYEDKQDYFIQGAIWMRELMVNIEPK